MNQVDAAPSHVFEDPPKKLAGGRKSADKERRSLSLRHDHQSSFIGARISAMSVNLKRELVGMVPWHERRDCDLVYLCSALEVLTSWGPSPEDRLAAFYNHKFGAASPA